MATSLTINNLLLNEPDWSLNPKYKVGFKTAIQTNIEGVERRTALMNTPNRSLTYRITETGNEAIKLKSKLYSKMDSNWGIPLWIDYTELSSPAIVSDTTINVNTIAYKHFYAGGYCIIKLSNDSYEYKQILSLTSTSITFSTGLSGTWATGTAVYPLMVSRIGKSIDNDHVTAGVLSVDITAQEMFYSDRNGYAATEPTYLEYFDPEGADVYPLYILAPDHNWSAQRKIKMINKYDDLQYLADQYIYNHWTETGQVHEFSLDLHSCEEIYQLENLFNHLQGRCFNFLLPSGVMDIKLSANALEADMTLSIEDTGFADYHTDSGTPYTTAKYIEIRQPNNDRIYCEISSATNTIITLVDEVGAAITDYANCMVSLMAESRFMQDEIQIEYLSQTVAESKFSCKWEHGDLVSRYDMNYTPPITTWVEFATATIDSSKIDSTLTDFPILINLTASSGTGNTDLTGIFTQISDSYNRFLCKTSAGDEIYADVERWDNSNNTAQLHIKVPSISSNIDTIVKLYYSETPVSNNYIGLSGSIAAQSAWDSNFKLVCHMAQDPSGTAPQILDSTSNNNDGTSNGSMTSGDLVEGLCGKALDFDGVDDYIDISSIWGDFTTNNTPFTLTSFCKTLDASSQQEIIEICEYASTNSGFRQLLYNNSLYSQVLGSAVTPVIKAGLTNSVYFMGTSVFDGTYLNTGINGVLTTQASGNWAKGSTDEAFIGCQKIQTDGAFSVFFYGTIAEIRISNTARSAAWIKATNYSLRDNLVSYTVT